MLVYFLGFNHTVQPNSHELLVEPCLHASTHLLVVNRLMRSEPRMAVALLAVAFNISTFQPVIHCYITVDLLSLSALLGLFWKLNCVRQCLQ